MRCVLIGVTLLAGCFDVQDPMPIDGRLDAGMPDLSWSPGPEPDMYLGRDLGRDLGHDPSGPSDAGPDLGTDASACLPSEVMCTSFSDYDCDGRIGCRDDCDCWPSSIGPCGAADPGDELDCSNGVSEDFDSLADCDDPDCSDSTACGGAGRCGYRDLGDRYPVQTMVLFPVMDQAGHPSCASSPSSPSSTYRWVAPRSDSFRFSVNGGAVAVFAATCTGPELGCGEGTVDVTLFEGQVVIVSVEKRGCIELAIE